jgi:hypothetical protein
MEEFVANVDRYSATESILHQSVDKWGLVSDTEGRRFGYVAEVSEIKQGNFNVEEYRSVEGFPGEFPGGVETRGLPALALIFHPHSVANFEMTCEGLAQRGGGLAWQIHFRQHPDRPNTMKHYRIGAEGQSYPVAIKGRAWIAADTYQIVRLETDLVVPIRIIRLSADRAAVDYGPVHFREKQIDPWLPKAPTSTSTGKTIAFTAATSSATTSYSPSTTNNKLPTPTKNLREIRRLPHHPPLHSSNTYRKNLVPISWLIRRRPAIWD